MVSATDILDNRWSSSGYPFRYLAIWHGKERVAKFRNKQIDTVLSAVELVEEQGWELVSIDEALSLACLRRVAGHQHDPR